MHLRQSLGLFNTQKWTWEISRPPQNSGQFFKVPWVSLIPRFRCTVHTLRVSRKQWRGLLADLRYWLVSFNFGNINQPMNVLFGFCDTPRGLECLGTFSSSMNIMSLYCVFFLGLLQLDVFPITERGSPKHLGLVMASTSNSMVWKDPRSKRARVPYSAKRALIWLLLKSTRTPIIQCSLNLALAVTLS